MLLGDAAIIIDGARRVEQQCRELLRIVDAQAYQGKYSKFSTQFFTFLGTIRYSGCNRLLNSLTKVGYNSRKAESKLK